VGFAYALIGILLPSMFCKLSLLYNASIELFRPTSDSGHPRWVIYPGTRGTTTTDELMMERQDWATSRTRPPWSRNRTWHNHDEALFKGQDSFGDASQFFSAPPILSLFLISPHHAAVLRKRHCPWSVIHWFLRLLFDNLRHTQAFSWGRMVSCCRQPPTRYST